MRQIKKEILEFIGTVGAVTHYHTTCLRDIKTPKTLGYNRLRQVARDIFNLEKMGLIAKHQ